MKKLITLACLLALAAVTFATDHKIHVDYVQTSAPTFPLGFTVLYAPKPNKAIAAVETPVGHIKDVVFGRSVLSPTAFVYAGDQIGDGKFAGGFGLRLDKSAGPSLFYHLDVAYGTAKDSNPHFLVGLGVSWVLSN